MSSDESRKDQPHEDQDQEGGEEENLVSALRGLRTKFGASVWVGELTGPLPLEKIGEDDLGDLGRGSER